MKPVNSDTAEGEMREDYDIRGGVRGKYYEGYRQGVNIVRLEPDVAAVFPSSEAVNRALRVLIEAAREQVKASEVHDGPPSPDPGAR